MKLWRLINPFVSLIARSPLHFIISHQLLVVQFQGKKSGFTKDIQERIMNEMKSGDYINLLKTFDKYFGTVYCLQTSNPEYLDAFMVEKSA